MKFEQLKINGQLKLNLAKNGFIEMTEVQKRSIPLILSGQDVLGSSETGSGKTLAFAVPIVSYLIENNYQKDDGVACIIVTPTRELAAQIYSVLGPLLESTHVTIGIITGGTTDVSEFDRIAFLNVIVCTPGRLLQHFEENQNVMITSLKFFVLDEADRMLVMGFKSSIERMLSYINEDRQNILFTATPSSKLAFVKMSNPQIIQVTAKKTDDIKQFYIRVEQQQKFDYLYTFLRSNSNSKIMVFFSTCKQANFFYLLLKKLRLFNDIFLLTGSISQKRRNIAYASFDNICKGILLCTDIGSRGLDFKNVHSVIQFDVPSDIKTYIHRCGRAGRNNCIGNGYVYLLENELAFLKELRKSKWDSIYNINIEERKAEVKSTMAIVKDILYQNEEIKAAFDRYIESYCKFIKYNGKKFSRESMNSVEQLSTLYMHD